jgi:hypothetical protein
VGKSVYLNAKLFLVSDANIAEEMNAIDPALVMSVDKLLRK